MSIVLVRHTQPEVAPGVCYGSTDLELAHSFAAESQAVIRALDGGEVLVSSPLQRCRKLAEKIAAAFALDLQIDDRVREMDFGSWEGQAWSEIPRHELDDWAENFLHARPHGGESVSMVRQRTHEALMEYRDQQQRYIVVTHAGVIKAALSAGDTAEHFETTVPFGGIVHYSATQDGFDDRRKKP